MIDSQLTKVNPHSSSFSSLTFLTVFQVNEIDSERDKLRQENTRLTELIEECSASRRRQQVEYESLKTRFADLQNVC